MAPETYYFFFSIIAVAVACLYTTNLIYVRTKGKTLIGNNYKPGTIEYGKLRKYSSNHRLTISAVIALICIANLIFDIYRLLHLDNQEYARFILVFAPILIALIAAAVAVKMNRQFGNGKYKKSLRKHDKENDSWLK
jgi:hypothetical protein